MSCVNESNTVINRYLYKATKLQFKFYADKQENSSTANVNNDANMQKNSNMKEITIPKLNELSNKTDHEILNELINSYNVPLEMRSFI